MAIVDGMSDFVADTVSAHVSQLNKSLQIFTLTRNTRYNTARFSNIHFADRVTV